jgi:hypothetical protein
MIVLGLALIDATTGMLMKVTTSILLG